MDATLQPIWARKLTGKPEFLTISDWEFEAPRIQNQGVFGPPICFAIVAAHSLSRAFQANAPTD